MEIVVKFTVTFLLLQLTVAFNCKGENVRCQKYLADSANMLGRRSKIVLSRERERERER